MIDAIVSIKPKYVEKILSGAKTVELRTRNINLPIGSRLWIYTTLPIGKVKLSVEIDFIELAPPKEIWKRYGKQICITRKEFDEYTGGRNLVCAIGLQNIRPLDKEICLETMRKLENNFQPPQFFSRLHPGGSLYSAFYN